MNQTIRSFKREASSISFINRKEDEKLLSESLYRNLHVLQRFHNATPDFVNICKPLMFIKPNPKAFLHVFHFLFNCLDSAEFNRRFHWPIHDKVNETRFRNCTLDYINRLNTLHQLGFETLKLHNIYIPGGLKFIKIVHKLTLTLKKRSINFPNVNDIPNANDQVAKLEEAIDDGFDFVARLEIQSKILLERSDEMNKMMVSFFQESTINITNRPCWNCLAEQWRNQLDHVVDNDVQPKLQRVTIVSKICADLKELLTKLFVDRRDNFIEYNKAKLVAAQNVLLNWNPDLEQAIVGMIQNNSINFDNLLQVFHFVLPGIMKKIEKFELLDLKAIEYESGQIEVLVARASQVQSQISDFEKEIQQFLKKDEERFRQFCLNVPNIPFNVMLTPIVTRKVDNKRQRFVLMDDNHSRIKLFNETLPLKPSRYEKHQNENDIAADGSSTIQSNKARNDALLILLKKKSSNANATQSLSNTLCLNQIFSPKFSPAISSTAVKNQENKYHGNELKISPFRMENAIFLSPYRIVASKFPKNSANRLNHNNLRGSSSRRWEINDNIVDVQQNLIVPTAVNGNCEAQLDIENVTIKLSLNEEEFLENISDSILNNGSN